MPGPRTSARQGRAGPARWGLADTSRARRGRFGRRRFPKPALGTYPGRRDHLHSPSLTPGLGPSPPARLRLRLRPHQLHLRLRLHSASPRPPPARTLRAFQCPGAPSRASRLHLPSRWSSELAPICPGLGQEAAWTPGCLRDAFGSQQSVSWGFGCISHSCCGEVVTPPPYLSRQGDRDPPLWPAFQGHS